MSIDGIEGSVSSGTISVDTTATPKTDTNVAVEEKVKRKITATFVSVFYEVAVTFHDPLSTSYVPYHQSMANK